MSDTLGILILVGIIIMFGVVNYYRDQQKKQRARRRPAATAKPATSRPTGSASAKLAPVRLEKKVKADRPITSNAITVVTYQISARDEFLGTIHVMNEHLTAEVASKRPVQAEVFLEYRFLGFGDRYNTNQRFNDFGQLARLFFAETETLFEDFRQQGWTIEPTEHEGRERIYHLSRE